LDVLLRLVTEFDIANIWTYEELKELSLVWHCLNLHADSAAAISGIKKDYIATTLSNASFRTLVDLARHCSICWNANISAELFHTYNSEKVFLSTAELLGLEPHKIAFVSSSRSALITAQNAGFATAHVRRTIVEEEVLEVDLTVRSIAQLHQSIFAHIEEVRKTSVETVASHKPAQKSFFQRAISAVDSAVVNVTGTHVLKDE